MTPSELRHKATEILTGNILRFWMEKMKDGLNGGFFGQMTGKGEINPTADKGAILCGRLLWAFSSAYRIIGDPEYLRFATVAKDYLLRNFYDHEQGGVFWALDYRGKPVDSKKQFYALGFAIYGLSEYYRACGDEEALDYAEKLFASIEEHSLDKEKGGYFEACTSDWQPIEDMRLSEKDANEKKTMNTHLHILEPYTNLLRALRLAGRCCNEVEKSHRALIEVFLNKIMDRSSGHLGLFFDENWVRRDNMVSYGHDIEASWLLFEAASVCGDAKLLEKVRKEAIRIAEAAAEGIAPDGSMYYEIRQDGVLDCDRHWWVQAETVVGYHYNYLLTGSQESASRRDRCLEYICRYLVDWENGEWWWSIKEDGSVNTADDKAGFWKCPYHNSRMCLELIEHTKEL